VIEGGLGFNRGVKTAAENGFSTQRRLCITRSGTAGNKIGRSIGFDRL